MKKLILLPLFLCTTAFGMQQLPMKEKKELKPKKELFLRLGENAANVVAKSAIRLYDERKQVYLKQLEDQLVKQLAEQSKDKSKKRLTAEDREMAFANVIIEAQEKAFVDMYNSIKASPNLKILPEEVLYQLVLCKIINVLKKERYCWLPSNVYV